MILHGFAWRNSKIIVFLPKVLRFRLYFLYFYIRVFGQNNMIFELLQQKPCRIIYKFRQNNMLGPETCEIKPTVGNRTCPDLPRPVLLGKFIIFHKIIGFTKSKPMILYPASQPANQPTNPPTRHHRHHPAAQPTVRGSVFLINKSCARRGCWRARAGLQKHRVFTMTFDGSNRS